MTEKRFWYDFEDCTGPKMVDFQKDKKYPLETIGEFRDIEDLLNALNEENKQLKKELEENKELIQFKEQVFNLIDKKLEENERELNGVDTAMYYANKGTLNELKKELQE